MCMFEFVTCIRSVCLDILVTNLAEPICLLCHEIPRSVLTWNLSFVQGPHNLANYLQWCWVNCQVSEGRARCCNQPFTLLSTVDFLCSVWHSVVVCDCEYVPISVTLLCYRNLQMPLVFVLHHFCGCWSCFLYASNWNAVYALVIDLDRRFYTSSLVACLYS